MAEMLPLRDTDPREVGGYRLLGRLGEGGQGVVFLADGPAGSRAAVKLLAPTTDPQVRSRFLKEVAAAQRVARFCTAQVLDAGIFERRPFIVSEYVDGPSLVEVVEQLGPRGGAALERIAVATLTALGAVHSVGMVHRDFKPANVLLGPDGPVVIDFGLATVPGMTTVGVSGQVAIGTPAFMAPEQLAGERVSAAADMWSWGVTIVFAGTGELPFRGESLTATAYAILHSEPNVGRLPEPLGSLVRGCLSKDAALRPSAREALSILVAAGARLMGPMPPMASVLTPDEKTAISAARTEPGRGGGEGQVGGGLVSRLRSGWTGRARWRWRAAALLTVIALVAGASELAFALSRPGASIGGPPGGNAGTSPQVTAADRARTQAINWILSQVSRTAIVSCDSLIYADLVRKGFPASNLMRLGQMSAGPNGSDLVVATAAVRAQFKWRLAGVWAPAVLASFGSGSARIDIRLVPYGGATAYPAAARSALRARKVADSELLKNRNIMFPATARVALRRGELDPRLSALFAFMAAGHPLRIVDFPNQAPGLGPASFMRWVDFATAVPQAHLRPAAYVRWMRSMIASQRTQYLPAWVQVTSHNGQTVLRVGYGAPSPLS